MDFMSLIRAIRIISNISVKSNDCIDVVTSDEYGGTAYSKGEKAVDYNEIPKESQTKNASGDIPEPKNKNSKTLVHRGTGINVQTRPMDKMQVEPSRVFYSDIEIYFYDLGAILDKSVLKPDEEYGWRYRFIHTHHTDYNDNNTYHFKLAAETSYPEIIGSITAKACAQRSHVLDEYIRRAVANGITYHTETSPGHYVRNCPMWCWHERNQGTLASEGMVLEMVPFLGTTNMKEVQNPKSNPDKFESWAKGNRKRYTRVDFYEHRSPYRQDTPDSLGSYWHRVYINQNTGYEVNMSEMSVYDIKLWADKEGWAAKEYWEVEHSMFEQYKYWMSVPAWDTWPRQDPLPGETSEQRQQRLWEDWLSFQKYSKEGARPGRIIQVRLPLPPGRYAPKIYGQIKSYSFYPLDLCRKQGDGNDGAYPQWAYSGYDYDLHRDSGFLTNYPTSLDLDWHELYEITEGIGDGYMSGSPMWTNPATCDPQPMANMNENPIYSRRDGKDAPGDLIARTSQQGKGTVLDYLLFNITERRRPKEIHFFSAPRGLKYVHTYLGGILGNTTYRKQWWTFGPANKEHVRIKGPQSIENMRYAKWPYADSYYSLDVVLMPSFPGALAWIVEVVYWDGSREAYSIWFKKALANNYVAYYRGTQDPLSSAQDFTENDIESFWDGIWSWF